MMKGFDVAGIVEIVHPDQFFGIGHPFFGEHGRPGFFVDDIIRVSCQPWDDGVDFVVEVGGFFRLSGNDQRCSGLVDQNAIDFIHDGIIEVSLNEAFLVELHVVSQIVETELVVGSIGDIQVIGGLAFVIVQTMKDAADRQPEEMIDRSHPFGVPPGQIVVDRNDMNAFAGQGVQIGRQGGGQGLAFTGLHFGDFSLMQHHTADELRIEMAHLQCPHRCLPHRCKGFREQSIQAFAFFDPLPECDCLRSQFVIGEGLHSRFEGIDLVHHRPELFEFPFVLAAENFCQPVEKH